jgi:hypothetical protein
MLVPAIALAVSVTGLLTLATSVFGVIGGYLALKQQNSKVQEVHVLVNQKYSDALTKVETLLAEKWFRDVSDGSKGDSRLDAEKTARDLADRPVVTDELHLTGDGAR